MDATRHTRLGLTRWNRDYRSASLGCCLDDAVWGNGYATEAARALHQWAFDTLDLNRVHAETDTRNAASARVLEKLGFVREGTLRGDCVVNSEVSDSWVHGLIRREWRTASEPDRPKRPWATSTPSGMPPNEPGVVPPAPTGEQQLWTRCGYRPGRGASPLVTGAEGGT